MAAGSVPRRPRYREQMEAVAGARGFCHRAGAGESHSQGRGVALAARIALPRFSSPVSALRLTRDRLRRIRYGSVRLLSQVLPGTDRPVFGALRERAVTESLRLWAVGELIGAKHALNGESVPYVAGSRDISKHSLRSITVTVPSDHLQSLFHEIRTAQEVLAA